MRSQLAREDISQTRGIYVVRSTWRDTLAPLVRYDEFGLPSSCTAWAPAPVVHLLLHEIAPEQVHLPITSVSADGSIHPPPDSLVVDMRNLRLQAQRNNSGL